MKYVFVGNRRFVLEEMLKKKLDVTIFVVKNTHLEREAFLKEMPHIVIDSKAEFLKKLDEIEFDVLISNGLPYILPISKMDSSKIFVNIHPSYLPDFKGVDPAHGSILFKRDGGATSHIMTDDLDAGDIISQVKIPYSDDLDVCMMYQLGFIGEKMVFNESLEREFKPAYKQVVTPDLIYYTRRDEDKTITFEESNEDIVSKVKAFNNKSQGCTFTCQGHKFKTYDADIMTNKFLLDYANGFDDLTILFVYEDYVVIKKDGDVLRLGKVSGSFDKLQINSCINDE